MRMILALRLQDLSVIHVIANANSKDVAKSWAINNCGRLMEGNNIVIERGADEVSFDRWSQDKKEVSQLGFKKYGVSFYLNNSPVRTVVQSSGVKSAYNKVKKDYGILDNINMLIYELNQRVTKKSSLAKSKEAIQDSEKVRKILLKSSEKIKSFPAVGPLAEEALLLVQMVADFVRGRYKDIPIGTIVGIVACLIYFISPVDFIPDVVPGLGQLDDVAVLGWAVKVCHDDIIKYKEWLKSEKSYD